MEYLEIQLVTSSQTFKANIESFIFFLKLPLSPVPINVTITALLENFNFATDLVMTVFTFESCISLNAL